MQKHSCSYRYFILSISALMLSGLLAAIIATARIPGLNELINDPQFSKKCLIIHVNLALGIWLHAFLATLFFLLPKNKTKNETLIKILFLFSFLGVLLMTSSIFFKNANPILSNYVPTIDHPIFLVGIATFALTLTFSYSISGRFFTNLKSNIIPIQAVFGLKCTALSFIFSIICVFISFILTPKTLISESYYEFIFWGPGHLLQICSQIGMLSAWIILLTKILGFCPINIKLAKIIFSLLLLSSFIGLFLPFSGTTSNLYYTGSTVLMKFGILPSVLIFLIIITPKLFIEKKRLFNSQYFNGFLASLSLSLLGYILGFSINEQNTLIPAHYHAAIGGVTVAFMTTAFWLCELFKLNIKNKHKEIKFARLQPLFFGIGQFIFVIGFSYAGIHGAARKSFGTEQNINSLSEMIGLITMGIGGGIAIIGGILFLYIFSKKLLTILCCKCQNSK